MKSRYKLNDLRTVIRTAKRWRYLATYSDNYSHTYRKGFLFVQFIFACTTCAEKIENANQAESQFGHASGECIRKGGIREPGQAC